MYLGFSAHTGDVSDEHDIISVSTHNVVWHAPRDGAGLGGKTPRRAKKPYRKGERSRVLGFFIGLFKWLLLIAVVAVAFVVFRSYRTQKNAKRF